MRRRRRPVRAWLWAIAALVGLFFAVRALILTLYPYPYRTSVQVWANTYKVNPTLVAAVIRVESKWQPRATSPTGARGLMQIMPDTARYIAGKAGVPYSAAEELYDPEVSIRLGTWYLADLTRQFNGNVVLAVAAYNGGAQNVKSWLQTSQWNGTDYDLQQIPFPETRNYVSRVLTDLHRYEWIYGRAAPISSP